jgi:hypothetical protein
VVYKPSLSTRAVADQISAPIASASSRYSFLSRVNKGCLKEKTNVAVSDGVKPWAMRDVQIDSSSSRTRANPGEEIY